MKEKEENLFIYENKIGFQTKIVRKKGKGESFEDYFNEILEECRLTKTEEKERISMVFLTSGMGVIKRLNKYLERLLITEEL